MDFSDVHVATSARWSPNAAFAAIAVDYRVIVRDGMRLTPVNVFTCVETVNSLEWSPQSRFLMCGMSAKGTIQVWDLENPEWRCTVSLGSAGLVDARWACDGSHFFTLSEDNLQICVWSVANPSFRYTIDHPKVSEESQRMLCAGSHSKKLTAFVERISAKDHISLFAVADEFEPQLIFPIHTRNAAEIVFSPSDSVLAVLDTHFVSALFLYSVNGSLLFQYEPYCDALGARLLLWNPLQHQQLVAIGYFDDTVRIVNVAARKALAEIRHAITSVKEETVCYEESVEDDPVFGKKRRYVVLSSDVEIPEEAEPIVREGDAVLPGMGTARADWSPDGKYFYTINGLFSDEYMAPNSGLERFPRCVWIWGTATWELHSLLIQISEVCDCSWSPSLVRESPMLAVSTSERTLFLWTEGGCSVVEIPCQSFRTISIEWRDDGKALILSDVSQVCACWLDSTPPKRT